MDGLPNAYSLASIEEQLAVCLRGFSESIVSKKILIARARTLRAHVYDLQEHEIMQGSSVIHFMSLQHRIILEEAVYEALLYDILTRAGPSR